MSPRKPSVPTCATAATNISIKKRKGSGDRDENISQQPCKMHKRTRTGQAGNAIATHTANNDAVLNKDLDDKRGDSATVSPHNTITAEEHPEAEDTEMDDGSNIAESPHEAEKYQSATPEEDSVTTSPSNTATVEEHPDAKDTEMDDGNYITDSPRHAEIHQSATLKPDDSDHAPDFDDESASGDWWWPERSFYKYLYEYNIWAGESDFAVAI